MHLLQNYLQKTIMVHFTVTTLTLQARVLTKLAGAVEYTDCFSTLPTSVPDTKSFDGEALVLIKFCGMQSSP